MKIGLVPFSILWCSVAYAQTSFEFTDQRAPIVHHTAVVTSQDGEWLFAGWAQNDGESYLFLERRDENGVLMSSPVMPAGPVAVPRWLMRAPNHDMVLVGESPMCSLPVYLTGFIRTDAEGQQIQQNGHGQLLATAAATSDPGIVVGGIDMTDPDQGRLWTVDHEGFTVVDVTLATGVPRGVAWAIIGELLVLYSDRIEVRSASSGDPLASAPLDPGAIGLAVLGGEGLAVLYEDRVVLLDTALAVMGSITLGASQARWMEYVDGSIWVTCDADLVRVEPVTGATTAFAQPAGTVTVNGSAVGGDRVLFAGARPVLDRSSGVIRGRILADGPVQAATDIAIALHATDSLVFHTVPAFPQIVTVYVQHTLALTNTGTTVIDQVWINSQRTLPLCGVDHQVDTLVHLDGLLPGATQLVTMPMLSSWPIEVPVGGSALFHPCYVALAPQADVDAVVANDHICVEIPVTTPTGIEEVERVTRLTMYPAPFNDRFTLRRDRASEATMLVHDAAGRELARFGWPLGSTQLEVDATTWPQGVVLLHYRDDTGARVLRAVKW